MAAQKVVSLPEGCLSFGEGGVRKRASLFMMMPGLCIVLPSGGRTTPLTVWQAFVLNGTCKSGSLVNHLHGF